MNNHLTLLFILCLLAAFSASCSKPVPAPDPAASNSIQKPAPAQNSAAQSANETDTDAHNADNTTLPVNITKHDEKDWGYIQTASHELRMDLTLSFEIPVFNEKIPGYQKMNDVFNKRLATFFNKQAVAKRWDFEALDEIIQNSRMEFEDSFKAEVTLVSDEYVSVLLMYYWFAGGVNDNGYETYVFDTKTGEPVTLDKYLKKDFASTKADVKKAIQAWLKENNLPQDTIEWNTFENMTNYKFVIQDGRTLVLFSKYEIAAGATGDISVEIK